ncbi:hypothetical protein [Timonella sp. A28]|uniref:hypothetical protein n=1 Tax=Timonella sp. A28 TaxID=3442640 RepID=UPI003EB8757F
MKEAGSGNIVVSVFDTGYSVGSLYNTTYNFKAENTAEEHLRFSATILEKLKTHPNDIFALDLIFERPDSCADFSSVFVEWKKQKWNNLRPEVYPRLKKVTGKVQAKDMAEVHKAHVYVVRNDPGENQDSLPLLFRKAADFVKENDLNFRHVESIRYVHSFDEEIRPYPELRITVLRGK